MTWGNRVCKNGGGKNFKQVVKVNGFIQGSVEKQIWQIYYPSYKLIIILSLSNCPICDDQVVISAAKWSFWRTLRLDDKYPHLCLIPLMNCICISPRQEEGWWVETVKHWGGGGGGGTTKTLCVIHLLHTHAEVAPFAKDQAAK